MLKRKIFTVLFVAVIAIPSLLVTVLAVEHQVMIGERNNLSLSTRSSFVLCSCYKNSTSKITNHTGSWWGSCENDPELNGAYSCNSNNYATTSLTNCSEKTGYKDAYVYERNSDGETRTNYKTNSLGIGFPSTASVSSDSDFGAICVQHEVTAPDIYSVDSRWHSRSYQ